MNKTKEMQ